MSVSTILNWNFQSLGETMYLTGIINVHGVEQYKCIAEYEINKMEDTAKGIYVETAEKSFFCKYNEISINADINALCYSSSRIIKGVCCFERNFILDNSSTYALFDKSTDNLTEMLESFSKNALQRNLIKGFFEKIMWSAYDKYRDTVLAI